MCAIHMVRRCTGHRTVSEVFTNGYKWSPQPVFAVLVILRPDEEVRTLLNVIVACGEIKKILSKQPLIHNVTKKK